MSFYSNIGTERLIRARKMSQSIYRLYKKDQNDTTMGAYTKEPKWIFKERIDTQMICGGYYSDLENSLNDCRTYLYRVSFVHKYILDNIDYIKHSIDRYNQIIIEYYLLNDYLVRVFPGTDERNFSL